MLPSRVGISNGGHHGNHQNGKGFMYSKPDFDGLSKILAVFEG